MTEYRITTNGRRYRVERHDKGVFLRLSRYDYWSVLSYHDALHEAMAVVCELEHGWTAVEHRAKRQGEA